MLFLSLSQKDNPRHNFTMTKKSHGIYCFHLKKEQGTTVEATASKKGLQNEQQ